MNITFKELPARAQKNPKRAPLWAAEADALRQNPGAWAHFESLDESPLSSRYAFVNAAKAGKFRSFPEGEFEARTVNGQAWVRYVGPTP